ncbi:MAG: ATP-binding protein, partial [Anaerolineae bacterium]|nr:ATP-binding protein [Anaerolineae bacterium]
MYLDPFPFGNTDGTSQPLDEQTANPLSTQEMMPSHQQTSLVIVGAKGTGKSYSLKRLHHSLISASSYHDYYIDEIQRDVPPSDDVQDFTFSFADRFATEKWSKAWRCAIVNAFTSHVLFMPQIKARLEDSVASRLLDLATHFYPFRDTPISVYAQLAHIIHEKDDVQLNEYLEDSRWQDYLHTIEEVLQSIPTLYFFMDSIDEHYHRFPYAWMKCQKGLFYCIRGIAADPRFLGGKLKIIIALRDHVIFDIFRNDPGSALLNDRFLLVLPWDQDSITRFLNSKISALSEQHLFAGQVRNINDWLGIDEAESFEQNHSLTSYVLSNTRLVPRDIVIVGNNLAEKVRVSKSLQRPKLSHAEVIRAITETSASLGREQVTLAQDHINTFNRSLTENTNMYDNLAQSSRLYDFLRQYSHKSMSRSALHQLADESRRVFGQGIDLPLILYQNRILGYVQDRNVVFYSGSLYDVPHKSDSKIAQLSVDRKRYEKHV